jgi:hypothetical protein
MDRWKGDDKQHQQGSQAATARRRTQPCGFPADKHLPCTLQPVYRSGRRPYLRAFSPFHTRVAASVPRKPIWHLHGNLQVQAALPRLGRCMASSRTRRTIAEHRQATVQEL